MHSPIARENTADPLDEVLRPEGMSVLFQPIVDLRRSGTLLHSLECLSRGPSGSALESASALFSYVRDHHEEVRADRACVAAAIPACVAVAPRSSFSINVHAQTLVADEHFAVFLAGALAAAGLAPAQLVVDVVAPPLLDERLLAGIDRLRVLGVRIAIDDIGLDGIDYEGLLECRPDFIKLDAATLKNSPERPTELRWLMLDSLVRFARSVGAQVVAEGVETLDQLDQTSHLGVNLVQGEFFGEPMPASALRRRGILGTQI